MNRLCVCVCTVAQYLLRQHQFCRWRLPLPVDVHRRSNVFHLPSLVVADVLLCLTDWPVLAVGLLGRVLAAAAGRQAAPTPWRSALPQQHATGPTTAAATTDPATTPRDDSMHSFRAHDSGRPPRCTYTSNSPACTFSRCSRNVPTERSRSLFCRTSRSARSPRKSRWHTSGRTTNSATSRTVRLLFPHL